MATQKKAPAKNAAVRRIRSMKTQIAPFVLALCSACAFAKDMTDPAVGAWAPASDPAKACLVVTNGAAWVMKDRVWWPGKYREGYGYAGSFTPLGDEGVRCYNKVGRIGKREGWIREKLAALGETVGEDEVAWWIEEERNGRRTIPEGRRLVRVAMPDFDSVRSTGMFVGYWKPVKAYATDGADRGNESPSLLKMVLKIREDHAALLYYPEATVTRDRPEPFRVEALVPLEAGLRCKDTQRDDPDWTRRGFYRGFCLDGDGRLHFYDYSSHIIFERTAKCFDDPVEARIRMHSDGAYHGSWGVNCEFNVMILSFDRGGHGSMTFFAGALLFDWKVENGKIACTFDPDSTVMAGCGWKGMTCVYSPESNTMTIAGIEGEEARFPQLGKPLKLLSQESQVEELFKRFEEAKKNPRWQNQLKRMKDRKARAKNPAN